MAGILYVVATPIGNLEDITLRALRVLKEVDLIAAEDTRHTQNLLGHYDIRTPLTSYHEHNERTKARPLVERLLQGQNIALVTDAGVPAISDPGYRIVVEAISAGIQVTPIPGPSALTAVLSASGLPTDRFVFEGFLPAKKKQRRDRLEALRGEMENPVRLGQQRPGQRHPLLLATGQALRPVLIPVELIRQLRQTHPKNLEILYLLQCPPFWIGCPRRKP